MLVKIGFLCSSQNRGLVTAVAPSVVFVPEFDKGLAPQIVWALEQHVDEVGRRVGLDGYDIRARNLLEDGDEGPTGQRMGAVGVKACLDNAAELVGYRRPKREGRGSVWRAAGGSAFQRRLWSP